MRAQDASTRASVRSGPTVRTRDHSDPVRCVLASVIVMPFLVCERVVLRGLRDLRSALRARPCSRFPVSAPRCCAINHFRSTLLFACLIKGFTSRCTGGRCPGTVKPGTTMCCGHTRCSFFSATCLSGVGHFCSDGHIQVSHALAALAASFNARLLSTGRTIRKWTCATSTTVGMAFVDHTTTISYGWRRRC